MKPVWNMASHYVLHDVNEYNLTIRCITGQSCFGKFSFQYEFNYLTTSVSFYGLWNNFLNFWTCAEIALKMQMIHKYPLSIFQPLTLDQTCYFEKQKHETDTEWNEKWSNIWFVERIFIELHPSIRIWKNGFNFLPLNAI